MEKGDLVAVYFDGEKTLFCVIGLEETSDEEGEETVLLALIDLEQVLSIPLDRLINAPRVSKASGLH